MDTGIPSTRLSIPADHPAYAGHFPGRPLLPGVALLAEVLEAALRSPQLTARIGPSPRLARVKFLAPITPGVSGGELTLRFDTAGARTGFEVRLGDQVAASGQFEPVARPADEGVSA
jgi:3-hydroxymyristoyl/3-hydroxydecanoyl-(acyl carrier protein) dehydratase